MKSTHFSIQYITFKEKICHIFPRTRRWYGGPWQKIGSADEVALARARRMSFTSSITAAASSVYSTGTRKCRQKECL